jgi:hypothetical protein
VTQPVARTCGPDRPTSRGSGDHLTRPDDKTLAGYRTLTFCLASGDTTLTGTCRTLSGPALSGRK